VVVEKVIELARRRKAGVEAFYCEEETTAVSFQAGRLHEAGTVQSRGVGIRVFADGRIGYASTNDLDRLEEAVESALGAARYGRTYDYALPDGRAPYPEVATYDGAVAVLPAERMVAKGEEAVARIQAAGARYVVNVDVERAVSRVRLANSAGLDRTVQGTEYSFVVKVQRTVPGDMLYCYGYDMSRALDVDEAAVVDRLLADLAWADRVVPVKTGPTNLVFPVHAVPTLLLPVAACVNGAQIVDNTSALAGKLGLEIVSPRISIDDDATVPLGGMSSPFDGEGTPARNTPLIRQGILASYVTDLAAAAALELPATGNARRGVKAQPQPGISNIRMAAGTRTLAEIIADLDDGVVVIQAPGATMGNTLGGELSATIGYGLKVERGEVVGRVKDCIFAGNVFEMLGPRLRELGSDVQRVAGHYYVPPVVVGDQTVIGRKA